MNYIHHYEAYGREGRPYCVEAIAMSGQVFTILLFEAQHAIATEFNLIEKLDLDRIKLEVAQ